MASLYRMSSRGVDVLVEDYKVAAGSSLSVARFVPGLQGPLYEAAIASRAIPDGPTLRDRSPLSARSEHYGARVRGVLDL